VLNRTERGALRLFGAFVVAVAIGVGVGRPTTTPMAEPVTVEPVSSSPGSIVGITVHVSGAVLVAGLVEVPDRSRVADVLAAAGGVTNAADLSQINLAESVSDGQRIVVPEFGAAAAQDANRDRSDPRVRLNEADASELQTLPGVGPVLAEAIASHRDEFGPFSEVEDLLDVPGIGEGKLATLRDLVIVP
jgi:competence protein ComEA